MRTGFAGGSSTNDGVGARLFVSPRGAPEYFNNSLPPNREDSPDALGQKMDIAHSSWQTRENPENGETEIVNS